ncbi:MAG: cupredoxin domain-containing protein [Rhizobiaceae bacterium]|nr:cupredoxin domain-containing protein [Rhizobiaceae bacterium]MCV0407460.1 cupredoxin domain-containing protein [Rhizobiaceae bacterium]
MKMITAALAALLALTGVASAAGTHSGGHGEAGMMTIGKPGKAADATRTVTITMMERDDGGMVFEPASLAISEGETLRLKFVNKGELDHEFVMDVHEGIMGHKKLMERFPEMEHDDPNSIRLAPGATGEIVWTFTRAGDFGFACLIPGHYDSGMKGDIRVSH